MHIEEEKEEADEHPMMIADYKNRMKDVLA